MFRKITAVLFLIFAFQLYAQKKTPNSPQPKTPPSQGTIQKSAPGSSTKISLDFIKSGSTELFTAHTVYNNHYALLAGISPRIYLAHNICAGLKYTRLMYPQKRYEYSEEKLTLEDDEAEFVGMHNYGFFFGYRILQTENTGIDLTMMFGGGNTDFSDKANGAFSNSDFFTVLEPAVMFRRKIVDYCWASLSFSYQRTFMAKNEHITDKTFSAPIVYIGIHTTTY